MNGLPANLTPAEGDLLRRIAKARAQRRDAVANDPRLYIRRALFDDARSGQLLAAYATHGRLSDLAAALEVNRCIGAALAAEAERRGRPGLGQCHPPRAGR